MRHLRWTGIRVRHYGGCWEPTGSEAARKDTGRLKTTTPTSPLWMDGSQNALISRSLNLCACAHAPRGGRTRGQRGGGNYGSKKRWVRQTARALPGKLYRGSRGWGWGRVVPTPLERNGDSQRCLQIFPARGKHELQVGAVRRKRDPGQCPGLCGFSPHCWSSGSFPAPGGDPVVSKGGVAVGYSKGIPATHTILGIP